MAPLYATDKGGCNSKFYDMTRYDIIYKYNIHYTLLCLCTYVAGVQSRLKISQFVYATKEIQNAKKSSAEGIRSTFRHWR